MRVLSWVAAAAVGIGLWACGGGGDGNAPPPGGESPAQEISVPGRYIVKLAANGGAWVALAEKARRFEGTTSPDRRLLLSADGGRTQLPAYEPPAGWSLIDFSVHPSREISIVLASDLRLRLLRLGRSGDVLWDQEFLDPQAETDPIVGGPFALMNSQSLVPPFTRDAARLAALGEDLVLGFRSGRFAVVLHRLAYSATGGFEARWRSLAEPGVDIGASLPTSGSFDPFKSLDHMWRLALDVDAQGHVAVALSLTSTELVAGHAEHFGEPLDLSVSDGFLLSRFSADGQRLYSVLHDTQQRAEVHGLRWVGERLAIVGRTRSVQAPDGWNGFVALLTDTNRTLSYELIDVEQGEIVFDIASLPGGQWLISGAAGYTQNPTGASISEAATPLLAQLGADGKLLRRIPLPAGPRHNQLRATLPWQGGWLLGGMQNGPGTHSADGDDALLSADGYLREHRALGF